MVQEHLVILGMERATPHLWWWEAAAEDAIHRLHAVLKAAYVHERTSAPLALYSPQAAARAVARYPRYQTTAGTSLVGCDPGGVVRLPPDVADYRALVVVAGYPTVFWQRCDGLDEAIEAAVAGWELLAQVAAPEHRAVLLLPHLIAVGARHADGSPLFPLSPYYHAVHRNPN